MTINTSSISAATITGSNVKGTTVSKTSSTDKSSLDKDAFLKLLAAQAKTQDPMNPSDSTQQIAQLAQFSSLEQMLNVATEMGKLRSQSGQQNAVQLVGHTVTYENAKTGVTGTGTVESVQLTSSGPLLTVGGTAGIDPATITAVR